jgi:hypothetical protein
MGTTPASSEGAQAGGRSGIGLRRYAVLKDRTVEVTVGTWACHEEGPLRLQPPLLRRYRHGKTASCPRPPRRDPRDPARLESNSEALVDMLLNTTIGDLAVRTGEELEGTDRPDAHVNSLDSRAPQYICRVNPRDQSDLC